MSGGVFGSGRLVRNRRTALWLGIGCYVLGSRLLYDAFEARGAKKPWAFAWLPGA